MYNCHIVSEQPLSIRKMCRNRFAILPTTLILVLTSLGQAPRPLALAPVSGPSDGVPTQTLRLAHNGFHEVWRAQTEAAPSLL